MILGFDFGTKKIGIAVGQSITQTASPVGTIQAKQGIPDWDALTKIVQEYRPEALVVGLALHENNQESDTASKARAFAASLEQTYGLKVYFANEYLTSFEARQVSKKHTGKQKVNVDAMAATIILQTWLQGENHVASQT